jgi:2-isopropylmalate synthase
MYTQGIDPGLDFSDIDRVIETVEYCNAIPVHQRHPYGGELVFTAFSGSHQDAIKKGFEAHARQNDERWRVPYLPIDPADLGRSYEAVIRVNSQSGKGGFAWVLEQDQGLKLPKPMQADFSKAVQHMADDLARELSAADIWQAFRETYHVDVAERPFQLLDYEETRASDGTRVFAGTIAVEGKAQSVSGRGNGLISSVVATLNDAFGIGLEVLDYSEHALSTGSDARAAAYVQCATAHGTVWGCGIDEDVATASVRAILSAANSAVVG